MYIKVIAQILLLAQQLSAFLPTFSAPRRTKIDFNRQLQMSTIPVPGGPVNPGPGIPDTEGPLDVPGVPVPAPKGVPETAPSPAPTPEVSPQIPSVPATPTLPSPVETPVPKV